MAIGPREMAARRELGLRLREFRNSLKLSGQAMAASLGWSQAKISGIERAKTMTSLEDVGAMLDALEVPDPVRGELLQLAESAIGGTGDWRNSSRSGLTRRQQDYLALTNLAIRIRHYQPVLLPGYLQTEDYARAAITIAGAADVDRALAFRMARRAALSQRDAPRFEVILLETVLRWCLGSWDVMRAQLSLLADFAGLPNVSVRVVPLHQVQRTYVQHPFQLFEFPSGTPPECLVETTTQDLRIQGAAALATFDHYYAELALSAMSDIDSLTFIHSVAQSYPAE